jgi:hypothetical protein
VRASATRAARRGCKVLRAMMADRLAGPPEFTDLAIVEEWTG